VRAGGLGVAGLDETRAALEHGQADELVLDPQTNLDEAARGELVRMAQLTSAMVEVVQGTKASSAWVELERSCAIVTTEAVAAPDARPFWVSLVLTIPVLVYARPGQHHRLLRRVGLFSAAP
jgi:hypothetical protein